ncbi:MAG: peptidoglycan bridge formation glycyltransferase FemA/FemB family protein [Elusimicrobia bacterium]|nr:peptidoglycan bridge formation glycyltransferase FemA/FemB family protein [Elusimicrobiota bacterium]
MREIGRDEWNKFIQRIPQVNLMQSWEYGEAQAASRHIRAQRFVLSNEQGQPFALLQTLTFMLPLIGGIARINRGPLLFEGPEYGKDTPEPLMRAAVAAVKTAARTYKWRILRFIPEFADNESTRSILVSAGLRKSRAPAWGSITLNLKRTPEELLSNMSHAWRKNLKAADRAGLELEEDTSRAGVDNLLLRYSKMQKTKDFQGISKNLIYGLSEQRGPRWDLRILSALKGGERIGGILFIGHGDTCTAIVNWSDEIARPLRPNNFIYWKAALLYRSLGYSWLDMGGLNEATPEGIARFKREMGGQSYRLSGEWR